MCSTSTHGGNAGGGTGSAHIHVSNCDQRLLRVGIPNNRSDIYACVHLQSYLNHNNRLDDVLLKRLCGVPIPFPPRYIDDLQYQTNDQAQDGPSARR